VVAPDQLPAEFRRDLLENLPGSGDANIPINPDNWDTITDGMAQVTQPGAFHTAGGEHLEGIDFGGKTGTAQVMSHQALDKTSKGRSTNPNVWFVGVTPTRNPELVVAVLWQNGNKSWFAARIGARLVSSYVEKQRRLAHNLVPPKAPAPPVEVGAVWTTQDPTKGKDDAAAKLHTGKFLVGPNGTVLPETQNGQKAKAVKPGQATPQGGKKQTATITSPAQAGPESARLSSPALPGKATRVKSR
jgi:penicillin-binding protein 2